MSANEQYYLKYVALNFGLGGLVTQRCPKELIEGYTDPVLDYYKNALIYYGGNAQINSMIQVDPMSSMNMVSFFTGEEEDDYTRFYATWMDKTTIGMEGQMYTSTKTTETTWMNPWSEEINVTGTDALQFPPDLDEED